METARLLVLAALAALAALAGCGQASAPREPRELPEHLRDTGLDAGDVLAFSPQYPLWTDGATKRRWIRLPPGTAIDASNPDAWVFPVGTQLWKEFAFDRVVETRYLERRADGTWLAGAYVWNADGTDAVLASRGAVIDLGGGRRHDVPPATDCTICHDARGPMVLGFSALQLSSDRDPGAPHAEPWPDGALDLRALVAAGLVVRLPDEYVVTPPRIAARTATERAARGYLHGNCGGCHDSTGELAGVGMDLRVGLVDGAAPAPDDPTFLLSRMRSRAPAHQMPPLGTRVVDDAAVALVARWLAELPHS